MDLVGDKAFYDTELLEGETAKFAPEIAFFTEGWLKHYRGELAGKGKIKVLDLGAGSCTTSLVLTKEPFVEEVASADISATRLSVMSKETQGVVGGDLSKLSFHEVNFNDPLPFADEAFDLVVMDAALHHSRNIWHTLTEIRRVLKSDGLFVAQREAFTSPLTHWITTKRLLKSPEVAAGVSENAYLKSQYDYYLRFHGFEPRFVPIYPTTMFKLLFFANGWLFSKYNIVSRKRTREEVIA